MSSLLLKSGTICFTVLTGRSVGLSVPLIDVMHVFSNSKKYKYVVISIKQRFLLLRQKKRQYSIGYMLQLTELGKDSIQNSKLKMFA